MFLIFYIFCFGFNIFTQLSLILYLPLNLQSIKVNDKFAVQLISIFVARPTEHIHLRMQPLGYCVAMGR